MIRTTRIKIISVTMTIITCFLCALATVIIVANYNANEQSVATLLVKKVNALRDNASYEEDEFDDYRSFTMSCDIGSTELVSSDEKGTFTDEDIQRYLIIINQLDLKKDSYTRVGVDEVELMVYNDGRSYHLAGIDRTLENNMLRDMTTTVIVVTVGSFFVLFLIIWALSYWMVRPVKVALEQQRKFISDASHELKTPLTIINANIAVLKSENIDNNWVGNIEDQATRMNVLIGDMLKLAHLDESSKNVTEVPKKFNISKTISNSALSFEAIAFEQHKKFDVEIQPDIQYTGIEADVSKLCYLLVDNAVKYCNDGGNILVKLEGSHPKLTVRNTGCLIDYADRFKIFERFYRGDNSRNRKTGGSGLGLSIVLRIAEIYGCHVSFRNADNSFEVRIIKN